MSSLDKTGLAYLWSKLKVKLIDKSDVGHTHSYSELSNKPTIPTMPTKLSQLTNDENFMTKTEVEAMFTAFATEHLGGYKWRVGTSSDSGKAGYVTVKKP